ncbi:hypothetical protein EIP91_002404 [Steccherinum ochraceum]|uniref:Uncharacterized protein n=1 Tax=Steccherinum ochraceum TaxID=92696 RepID=A0A4R0REQ5_9APHY|nr:hypothetical protein EIP91_002404 [Steccherinum ochraceum]
MTTRHRTLVSTASPDRFKPIPSDAIAIRPVRDSLHGDNHMGPLPAAAALTNTSWFKSATYLMEFTLALNDLEHDMPHISAIVSRALELSNRSRLLTVRLEWTSGLHVAMDPHGTLDVVLWQKRLEDLIPDLIAIFRTVSLTLALHTLWLRVIMDRREEVQVNSPHWEALDGALASPVNDSIQRYELKVSRSHVLGDPSKLMRKSRCMNDVIQALLPKFTANRAPVDPHCTSCILHKRGPLAAENTDSDGEERDVIAKSEANEEKDVGGDYDS